MKAAALWCCRWMILISLLALLVQLLGHHWKWCALGVFNVVIWAYHERALR